MQIFYHFLRIDFQQPIDRKANCFCIGTLANGSNGQSFGTPHFDTQHKFAYLALEANDQDGATSAVRTPAGHRLVVLWAAFRRRRRRHLQVEMQLDAIWPTGD